MPEVVTGIITIEIPNIRKAYKMTIIAIGVSLVKKAKGKVAAVRISMPPMANRFAPYLSKIDPVIGIIAPITIAPGSSIKPEWKADSPRIF